MEERRKKQIANEVKEQGKRSKQPNISGLQGRKILKK
jgi:hypothetical protein